MDEKRKIVLVGCGFVGMNMAYSFLNTEGVGELVLIDADQEKAIGEVMDLQHGLPYARGKVSIKAGGHEEYWDATVAAITTGVTQKPIETCLDSAAGNTVIMKGMTEQIMTSGFDGILVIVSSPVDATTYIAQKMSGLPTEHVIGSGTILDTVHLRYIVSEYPDVSTSNIHAYIVDERGDSNFVPRANAYTGCRNLLNLLGKKGRDLSDLHDIYTNAQQIGYEIMKRKRSTYYGTGLSLNRLMHAILDGENVILTVSVYWNNEYGQEGSYIGVPTVVNHQGICKIVKLDPDEMDQVRFNQSCEMIRDINTDAVDPLLQKTNSALPVQYAENGKSGVPAYRNWFPLDCG